MSLFLSIHPENPQSRLIDQVAQVIEKGGLIAYPTESGYALGCLLDNKAGADRIRAIRQLPESHQLTLMCKDLSNISEYAKVGNMQFRYLKSHLPGPYTFILPASREVPRRLQNPKKKTIGIRVSPNKIANELLSRFDQPLISSTLLLSGEEMPMTDAWEIKETLGHALDAIVDGGFCGYEPTTVIDFTEEVPVLVRQGQGAFNE
ncbi:L-threonylcarbamoyladenylate synthase [Galenea microaerophila]